MTGFYFNFIDEPPMDQNWGSKTFYNRISALKVQNYFLKPMILFLIFLIFSSPQTTITITSENPFQPAEPSTTQFLATLYDCSEHYNLGHFS